MKIVLAGTGFVGSEILKQCISNHFIHHIYVLTRKDIDTSLATHPKVTVVQHADFDDLPDHLFERFRGWDVSGCIWALGPRSQLQSQDEMHKVGVKFPTQAAEQFAKIVAPSVMKKPFRFIFISGHGAEQDQFKTLWYWSQWRKMKGMAEKSLFELATKDFQVIALRPGTAIAAGEAVTSIIAMGTTTSITVDRIAKAAIRVVLDGDGQGRTILEHKDCLGDDWAQINSLSI